MIDTRTPVILSRPEAVRRRARSRLRRRAAAVTSAVLAVAAISAAGAAAALILPGATSDSILSVSEGYIPDGETLRLEATVPAVERLDPRLREALASVETAAAADGLPLQITSGWRSAAYQQWLFDDAVRTHGEEAARELVATPQNSSHVTGDAVDLGPLDLQFWLMQHGAEYGLCQIYANERWHWELATTPGGVCPALLDDASAPRG